VGNPWTRCPYATTRCVWTTGRQAAPTLPSPLLHNAHWNTRAATPAGYDAGTWGGCALFTFTVVHSPAAGSGAPPGRASPHRPSCLHLYPYPTTYHLPLPHLCPHLPAYPCHLCLHSLLSSGAGWAWLALSRRTLPPTPRPYLSAWHTAPALPRHGPRRTLSFTEQQDGTVPLARRCTRRRTPLRLLGSYATCLTQHHYGGDGQDRKQHGQHGRTRRAEGHTPGVVFSVCTAPRLRRLQRALPGVHRPLPTCQPPSRGQYRHLRPVRYRAWYAHRKSVAPAAQPSKAPLPPSRRHAR